MRITSRRTSSGLFTAGVAAMALLGMTACSSPPASPQAAGPTVSSTVTTSASPDANPSGSASQSPSSPETSSAASSTSVAASPSSISTSTPTKAPTTAHTTTSPAARPTTTHPTSASTAPSLSAFPPNQFWLTITPQLTGQTDANAACADVTVEFANTTAAAVSGAQYWVDLEWRDSAGHDRYGHEEVGPFNAPTVAAKAVVKAKLHACATTAAPAGKHATVTSITRWSY